MIKKMIIAVCRIKWLRQPGKTGRYSRATRFNPLEAPDRPTGKGTRPRKWINFEEVDEIGMPVEFGDYYWNLPGAVTF